MGMAQGAYDEFMEATTGRVTRGAALSKPALHTLPLDRLLAKLRALTNVRVVADPEAETGWKLDHDPFPGWETTPDW